MTAFTFLSPQAAIDHIRQGAVLVDIRSPAEYQREHIADAVLLPLSQLQQEAAGTATLPSTGMLIFHCQSGVRTRMAQGWLEQFAQSRAQPVAILAGGIRGWRKAGLPLETASDSNGSIDIMRQVHIVAGALILLGVGLGWWVSATFFALAALVGAGLLLAGVTGFCGMRYLLAHMPWNRPASAAGAACYPHQAPSAAASATHSASCCGSDCDGGNSVPPAAHHDSQRAEASIASAGTCCGGDNQHESAHNASSTSCCAHATDSTQRPLR